jgi:5'-3' exonuclease
LVGNDFLPNLPGFEIRQAGIDSLFHVYKRMLPEMGGYITNNGKSNYYEK